MILDSYPLTAIRYLSIRLFTHSPIRSHSASTTYKVRFLSALQRTIRGCTYLKTQTKKRVHTHTQTNQFVLFLILSFATIYPCFKYRTKANCTLSESIFASHGEKEKKKQIKSLAITFPEYSRHTS